MIIKSLKLKNIRSYKNAEINFPVGSTVLAGDIGSGKTTVLLAIEFAFFGLQPGQKGNSLLRNGEEEGSIILEIEINDRPIIIERGLKRGKTVNQTEVSITYEGEKKEMSINEAKNFILQLLSYPKEFAKKTNILYKFTVYTPQEEMKQIILESPETRLNTLRHIFGIDKYKRIEDNTELFTAQLRESIREYEGRIRDIEDLKKKLENKKANIETLNQKVVLEKNEFGKKKEERKFLEKELEEVNQKIKEKEKYEREADKARIMIVGKKEMFSNIKKEKEMLTKQIEEIKKVTLDFNQIDSLQKEKLEREKEREEKNKEYMDIVGQTSSLNSKIIENNKLKSQISSLQFCPTCLQQVAQNYKDNVLNKFDEEIIKSKKLVEALEQNKNTITEKIDFLKTRVLELDKKIAELRILKVKIESLTEKENRILDLEKQEVNLEKDMTLLDNQILSLKEAASELKKFESVYESKNKDLENAFKQEKYVEIRLAQVSKEIELTQKEIKEIEVDIESKEKLREKMNYLKELEEWLSSEFLNLISFTEKNIMLKLREEFSKLFNEWFNTLVPESFSVSLDEDFTPVIQQQDFELDYAYLSGGERTAIALAYRLSLNQTINSLLSKMKTKDIVILDEPTDGFSDQQLDKMRDVLNQLNIKQLIIVSHEAKIESFVQNIIKFKKEDGSTRVVS